MTPPKEPSIEERLERFAEHEYGMDFKGHAQLLREAAAEIRRLRAKERE